MNASEMLECLVRVMLLHINQQIHNCNEIITIIDRH